MQLNFYKYQGTGNDFIMVDDRHLTFPIDDIGLIARLCDRKFGIGADGLILLQPHPTQSYFMKYYNSDGNESTMCGNGGRCLAAFAIHQQAVSGNHAFMAMDGLHEVEVEGELTRSLWIKIKMQDVLNIDSRPAETFVLNTGSPHYVKFISEPLSKVNLVNEAKSIRYNDEFSAQGININFINFKQQPNRPKRFKRGCL